MSFSPTKYICVGSGLSVTTKPGESEGAALRRLRRMVDLQRGIEQGAPVASASSAPERPVGAPALVKAHKRMVALQDENTQSNGPTDALQERKST